MGGKPPQMISHNGADLLHFGASSFASGDEDEIPAVGGDRLDVTPGSADESLSAIPLHSAADFFGSGDTDSPAKFRSIFFRVGNEERRDEGITSAIDAEEVTILVNGESIFQFHRRKGRG